MSKIICTLEYTCPYKIADECGNTESRCGFKRMDGEIRTGYVRKERWYEKYYKDWRTIKKQENKNYV